MSSAATALQANLDAFEAVAKRDGVLNEEGFFTQSDWEFELDTMPERSRSAFEAHLAKAKAPDTETAMFLKSFLMGERAHFTPFED